MKIDHIGYAVKQIDQAIDSFKKLGYSFGTVIDDIDRNIKITFGEKDGYRIELVCPLDKRKGSPVDTYLKNVGTIPYHICYQAEKLEDEIKKLTNQGFKTVTKPTEPVAFGGKKVVFLMNLNVGLMEIVEI